MIEQPAGRGSDRDRDVTGRPRNARPRDALGRPLPHGACGVIPIDEDKVRNSTETLQEAQRLLDIGRPFQAHEVLELRWKRCPQSERELWQALAQLAVAVTHSLRGNTAGARSLLNRAHTGLIDYQGPGPRSLDATGVVRWLEAAATNLEESPPNAQDWLAEHPPPLALGSDRHSRRT